MMRGVAPYVRAGSVGAFGMALLWVFLSGRYTSFVPVSSGWMLAATGVGLVVSCLALIGRAYGDCANEAGAGHVWSQSLICLLCTLFLVLPFSVSPSELAASPLAPSPAPVVDSSPEAGAASGEDEGEIEDEGEARASSSASSPVPSPSEDKSNGEVLELTDANFYPTIMDLSTSGRAHDGQRVQLTGFVLSEEAARGQSAIPRRAEGDSFAVARMAIWCCAADAIAVGFAVRWEGDVPPVDSWVQVSGTLRVRGGRALVIEADSVTAVEAPSPEFVLQNP